ncbi:hypothetical protein [Brevundimonas goettingensis]|uniref:Uncharacterized protein n=1 Tax=Brevundimonas goettingensis TaxID=2774190 RepID=A0A975C374_9CAUL|nr:hypothetical protein [Brevundimonas goettingensis]QTC91624.1 hypothetical protein IFJ75_01415 [Brevundimonas goettingensis]
MADATTAARERVDRALAALERKVLELKARPASAPAIADDDLFAIPAVGSPAPNPADQARIAALEAAGRDASAALARAADQLRGLLSVNQEPED